MEREIIPWLRHKESRRRQDSHNTPSTDLRKILIKWKPIDRGRSRSSEWSHHRGDYNKIDKWSNYQEHRLRRIDNRKFADTKATVGQIMYRPCINIEDLVDQVREKTNQENSDYKKVNTFKMRQERTDGHDKNINAQHDT
jgi:hypothetical protein